MFLALAVALSALEVSGGEPGPAAATKGAGAASAVAAPGTNEPAYQPTRYPKVTARHLPGNPPSPALVQAALQGRRTPITAVDGPTSAGGKLLRYDDTYMIPAIAPAGMKTNALAKPALQPAVPGPSN